MSKGGGAMKKSTIAGGSLAIEMTLREAIAMQILAGCCAQDDTNDYRRTAEVAVMQADALLVALYDDPGEEGDAKPEA